MSVGAAPRTGDWIELDSGLWARRINVNTEIHLFSLPDGESYGNDDPEGPRTHATQGFTREWRRVFAGSRSWAGKDFDEARRNIDKAISEGWHP